jgi:hypothetical protein
VHTTKGAVPGVKEVGVAAACSVGGAVASSPSRGDSGAGSTSVSIQIRSRCAACGNGVGGAGDPIGSNSVAGSAEVGSTKVGT